MGWRVLILMIVSTLIHNAMATDLIELSSEEGERLKNESTLYNSLLVERHKSQVNMKYCGPASLADITNGINAGYRIKYGLGMSLEEIQTLNKNNVPITVDENDIVNYLQMKRWQDKRVMDTKGLTLAKMRNAATLLGYGVNTVYTTSGEISEELKTFSGDKPDVGYTQNIDFFRTEAKRFIKKADSHINVKGVIINFELARLGYEGQPGHFSPLGGYHEGTDRFLLVDVYPGNPSVWVKTINLWNAMTSSIDSDSNFPRGFLQIYEAL